MFHENVETCCAFQLDNTDLIDLQFVLFWQWKGTITCMGKVCFHSSLLDNNNIVSVLSHELEKHQKGEKKEKFWITEKFD